MAIFDTRLRPLIDPALVRLATALVRRGVTANALTVSAFAMGIAGAVAIAIGHPWIGLALFLAGRAGDGLDGAVAGQTARTDRGGFLDIVLDFVVYAAIPLAFAFADPTRNALPAAVLLASFLANGAAFLAFAALAARRGLETRAQGAKSLYYLAGLAEGAETIAVFALACLWADWFAALALAFAALCTLSAAARIAIAWRVLV